MLHFFETLPNFDFDLPDVDGETPLFRAIGKRKFEIVKFLVSKGVNLNTVSHKNGYNVIYIAACLSSVEILEYFLSFGLNPNIPTVLKRTALVKACWLGRADSVKLLLKHPDIKIDH